MRDSPFSYALALGAVAVVAAVTALWQPVLGSASAALLFLLPVLLASTRGGVGPALVAAGAGALAYNFFLLPPRFTLRIHGVDNVVSVAVLFAVALVTARLATALRAREADASLRAAASEEAAEIAALLGRGAPSDAAAAARAEIGRRYGPMIIVAAGSIDSDLAAASAIDRAAAAWAAGDRDATGHGTAIMPAADWTFLPLGTRDEGGSDVAAVARPADGSTRKESEIAQLHALARLIGQARDKAALIDERQSRLRLEDRDALRRTMLASLAHDFRTPLAVLAGEIAAIEGGGDAAARALAAARRLDDMMNDLIGLARLESGALAVNMEAIDLVDSVGDADGATRARRGAVSLTAELPADLPLVTADPVLLRHILVNLIDNALRHAARAVTISARAEADTVTLTVADDGPGIDPADRAGIFDRFRSADVGDRRGGTGLGLAIVRGFADAMAMSVSVGESGDGGAAFHLVLPARRAAA